MKLVRNAVTDANPDLRGKKHHFTIEGASAEVLEMMDDKMTAEGWDNDTCPLYEEGFSCGYWIDLSDIAQFKADYKAVKASLKAAPAPAVEVEAAPEITPAHAAQITFFAANDYTARRAIVDACHAEALKINVMANVQADVIAAPYLPALVDACHAEALAEDRAHNSAWCALAMYPHFNELETDERRRKALNAAHAEALACNAAFDEYRAEQAAPVPAADIDNIDIRTLHEPIEAEYGQPYAAKVVTRAYVARSIARALASQARHAEKYTAQDVRWLAEHNAEHAHRNGVITGEEYATLYHMINAAGSRPLAILDAVRAALLAGVPVMDAARAA